MDYKKVLGLENKSIMLFVYYFAYILFIYHIAFEKNYLSNDSWFLFYAIAFILLAPVCFWVLLQKPIIEVHITQKFAESKKQYPNRVLLAVTLVLFVILVVGFFLVGERYLASNKAIQYYNVNTVALIKKCDQNLSLIAKQKSIDAYCSGKEYLMELNAWGSSVLSKQCDLNLFD